MSKLPNKLKAFTICLLVCFLWSTRSPLIIAKEPTNKIVLQNNDFQKWLAKYNYLSSFISYKVRDVDIAYFYAYKTEIELQKYMKINIPSGNVHDLPLHNFKDENFKYALTIKKAIKEYLATGSSISEKQLHELIGKPAQKSKLNKTHCLIYNISNHSIAPGRKGIRWHLTINTSKIGNVVAVGINGS